MHRGFSSLFSGKSIRSLQLLNFTLLDRFLETRECRGNEYRILRRNCIIVNPWFILVRSDSRLICFEVVKHRRLITASGEQFYCDIRKFYKRD